MRCRKTYASRLILLTISLCPFVQEARQDRANSLLGRMGTDQMGECKLLNVNGGGDRTRTCIAFRPAVFKTAALPLCDPSALWLPKYSAWRVLDKVVVRASCHG